MSKKQRILSFCLWILALVCFVYFVVLMVSIGPSFRFNYVWLLSGLFFLGLALTFTYSKMGFYWMPKPLIILIELIVLTGLLLFVVVEALIFTKAAKKPEREADYLIVLGAKVNGTKPSHILYKRIEKAYEYLEGHPDCKVIVSGGKGEDEGISEAEAMRNGLLERGIEENRIILEDTSTSTKENLDNSKAILEELGVDVSQTNILVVTTNFHVFRALGIAKKAGFEHVEGLAGGQVWYLIPTNYVREFFALMKDFLIGNLSFPYSD